MSVKVQTMSGSDAEYPNGTSIEVSDGHLFVKRAGAGGGIPTSKSIGIHAPGTWASAKVE